MTVSCINLLRTWYLLNQAVFSCSPDGLHHSLEGLFDQRLHFGSFQSTTRKKKHMYANNTEHTQRVRVVRVTTVHRRTKIYYSTVQCIATVYGVININILLNNNSNSNIIVDFRVGDHDAECEKHQLQLPLQSNIVIDIRCCTAVEATAVEL